MPIHRPHRWCLLPSPVWARFEARDARLVILMEMVQISLFDAATEPVRRVAAPAVEPRREPGPTPPFIHPLADSHIDLNGYQIAYRLRRAQRRSIGLMVGLDGLSVSVPRLASRRDIEAALRDKAGWIVRKLQAQGERARQLKAVELDWQGGATVPYLGQTLQVQVAHVTLSDSSATPATLQLKLPTSASPVEVQRAVVVWLKRQALALFAERCEHYAPLLRVQYTKLGLSTAQTRWGSAHASGAIRLNWRLIHFGLPVIDYVVAHELAHLREMNHSPRFWALVESVVPEMAAAQKALRDTVLPAWR